MLLEKSAGMVIEQFSHMVKDTPFKSILFFIRLVFLACKIPGYCNNLLSVPG